MDWSLVLASQHIECVIEPPGEAHGWALLVEARDHARARAAIEQYRLENRGWVWGERLSKFDLRFQWSSLVWCAAMAAFYVLSTTSGRALLPAGRMDSTAAGHGEWWRLFTAVWLHADIGHLMANLTTGLLVLGLVMGRYGIGGALLAAHLAGAGGNLAGLLLYPHPYKGVGASGVVMGGLGMLAVQSLGLWRRSPQAARLILTGVIAGALLFVLLGLDPRSDVVAHLGGFVSGLVLGALLATIPRNILLHPWINLALGLALAGLSLLTWGLALR